MLQISSGLFRGLKLRSPAGDQTRPSSERLRQSIFNVLRHFRDPAILEGATILDLCAGTGALGLDAVSNGATGAVFVESHKLALAALRENIAKIEHGSEAQGLEPPRLTVIAKELKAGYERLPEARVVFCDPPYDRGVEKELFELEAKYHRLEPQGLLIYESRDREKIVDTAQSVPGHRLRCFDTKIYGDSAVHFFIKETSL